MHQVKEALNRKFFLNENFFKNLSSIGNSSNVIGESGKLEMKTDSIENKNSNKIDNNSVNSNENKYKNEINNTGNNSEVVTGEKEGIEIKMKSSSPLNILFIMADDLGEEKKTFDF